VANNGSVVQLDRMADSGSVGWRFESSRDHRKKSQKSLIAIAFKDFLLLLGDSFGDSLLTMVSKEVINSFLKLK